MQTVNIPRYEVADDLQATLAYTAGYPGPDTPAYKAQFDVEGAAMSDLYDGLAENDLLRDQDPVPPEETPIGGATLTATVTADGETYEIPAHTADGAPLQPLAGLVTQRRFERARAIGVGLLRLNGFRFPASCHAPPMVHARPAFGQAA